jgi:hypothetical protein
MLGMTRQRTKDMMVANDPTKKNGSLKPPRLYKVEPIKGPISFLMLLDYKAMLSFKKD